MGSVLFVFEGKDDTLNGSKVTVKPFSMLFLVLLNLLFITESLKTETKK